MNNFSLSDFDYERFNAGHLEYDDLAITLKETYGTTSYIRGEYVNLVTNTQRETNGKTINRRLFMWLYILAGALSGSCGFWSFGIVAAGIRCLI